MVSVVRISSPYSNSIKHLASYIGGFHAPAERPLGHKLAQFEGCVNVHITHIKPGESETVMADEMGQLGAPHRIRALMTEQVTKVGGGV